MTAPGAIGSDRSFGFVFTVFFALVGVWPILHRRPMRLWAVCLSAAFLFFAILAPRGLHPLNVAWTMLGRALGRITNPILTALMFYAIFTPAGMLLRLLGKDLLRLKPDPAAPTYWIPRKPATQNMAQQF